MRWESSTRETGKKQRDVVNSFPSDLHRHFYSVLHIPDSTAIHRGMICRVLKSKKSYSITSDRFWCKLQKPLQLSWAVAVCESAVAPEEGSLVWNSKKIQTSFQTHVTARKPLEMMESLACFLAFGLILKQSGNNTNKTSCHIWSGRVNITF